MYASLRNVLLIKQKHRGITTFFVERETPGLTVAKPEDKLGIKASGTCMIHFDNVRVCNSKMDKEIKVSLSITKIICVFTP